MWPGRRPGDLLRGRRSVLDSVRPGGLVVVDDPRGGRMIHRLDRHLSGGGRAGLVLTSGDRSGPDPPLRPGTGCIEILAVLRRGRWRGIPPRPPLLLRCLPEPLVRALSAASGLIDRAERAVRVFGRTRRQRTG